MLDRIERAIERCAPVVRGGVRVFVGLMLFGALIAAAHTCTGCGASALVAQADAAHVAAVTLHAAGDVATAARDAEMDAAEREHPQDPEHDAAIDAVAERWRPLGVAFDAARAALIGWIAEIEAAHGEDGQPVLARILTAGARLVALYAQARLLAAELGHELPNIGGE